MANGNVSDEKENEESPVRLIEVILAGAVPLLVIVNVLVKAVPVSITPKSIEERSVDSFEFMPLPNKVIVREGSAPSLVRRNNDALYCFSNTGENRIFTVMLSL